MRRQSSTDFCSTKFSLLHGRQLKKTKDHILFVSWERNEVHGEKIRHTCKRRARTRKCGLAFFCVAVYPCWHSLCLAARFVCAFGFFSCLIFLSVAQRFRNCLLEVALHTHTASAPRLDFPSERVCGSFFFPSILPKACLGGGRFRGDPPMI